MEKIFDPSTHKSLQTQMVNYVILLGYPSQIERWKQQASTGKLTKGDQSIDLNKT